VEKGILEKEADIFATIILVPCSELDDRFEERIIGILLDVPVASPHDTPSCKEASLEKILDEMFAYFEARTREILPPQSNGLNPQARRNIHLRLTRYLRGIEEKIIITFGKPHHHLTEVDVNRLGPRSEAVRQVKEAHRRYA
jgi:hypothetical protein